MAVSAAQRLEAYMAGDLEHPYLRSHQIDVMQSLYKHLASGATAGYIKLPMAAGKTILAAEIAQALDVPTIMASHSQQALEQTAGKFQKFTPEVHATNYYAKEKNVGGQVINTTYHSLLKLATSGEIDPKKVGLIICDEAQTALGELRHTAFRHFPNALMVSLTATPYFTQLEGYQARGLVDSSESWLGMFSKQIHDMSLEEAIERKIIAQLDVHMIESAVSVGRVRVSAAGNYDIRQIEKYLTRHGRDYLALGMLAGPDKLPANIQIPPEQQAELSDIHQKINGKRTIVFGVSIDHVESLKEQLLGLGLAADTVHHQKKDRDRILAAHTSGETPILLSVDMLRVGWDSPETEVGLFLAPTQSGIVANQELGRILRLSPETGKERAIAIQLVDRFEKPGQTPVLIPDLFDPLFILRGSMTGRERKIQVKAGEHEKPLITFSGMNIAAIIKETTSQVLLRERFKNATIEEMADVIGDIVKDIQKEHFGESTLELYQRMAAKLPEKASNEAQEVALQAVASLDSRIATIGKNVFTFLNMKSVLSAIEPYLGDDMHQNEDLVQSAIENVIDKFGTRDRRGVISQDIYLLAKRGAADIVAEREKMPVTWVLNGLHKIIKAGAKPEWRNDYERSRSLDTLANTTGIGYKAIRAYIKRVQAEESLARPQDRHAIAEKASTLEHISKDLNYKLHMLSERERMVLQLRFGLNDGIPRTLEETGRELRFTGERARQIESRALAKLRHLAPDNLLHHHLED